MDKNVTTYKANKSAMSAGLVVLAIVFVGLILPLLVEGAPVEARKLLGLGIFCLMGIILTIAPLAARLEIDQDSVKSYFLNFRVSDLQASNIQVVEYGNLFRAGGLGMGKGLRIRVKSGISKTYSIGEKLYGKEAIAHAKRVLESRL